MRPMNGQGRRALSPRARLQPGEGHRRRSHDRLVVTGFLIADRVGLPTTSTMTYGHADHRGHSIKHFQVLADIQEDTGGFTAFVPLPLVHQSSPTYLAGVARSDPTPRDNRAVHAMARAAGRPARERTTLYANVREAVV